MRFGSSTLAILLLAVVINSRLAPLSGVSGSALGKTLVSKSEGRKLQISSYYVRQIGDSPCTKAIKEAFKAWSESPSYPGNITYSRGTGPEYFLSQFLKAGVNVQDLKRYCENWRPLIEKVNK